MKIALILCSDMHMDIEVANSLISSTNHEWVADYTLADIVIIMTCAFGTKKHYSMFVIADVLRNVKSECKTIATGCLPKTNYDELNSIPNLDVKSIDEVRDMLMKQPCSNHKLNIQKIRQNVVIISNGCLKKCSYCIYSFMENHYTSKTIDEIISEVKELSVYESTIYITGAHETSDYGVDIYGKRMISELLKKLCTQFPNCNFVIGWFHPSGLTSDVIETISECKNIIQIMVHIQHVDNDILKHMNRPKFEVTDYKIKKLHLMRPDLSISTELIVGFPGETTEKFEALKRYLEDNRSIFQDIGVASYEPVFNTDAAKLPELPDYSVRSKRMEYIQKTFNATTYPAPSIDFKPLLSSYLEANYLLSKLPNICINAKQRQQYLGIAGTDTEFKIGFITNIHKISKEMIEEMFRSNQYTSSFKKWLSKVVKEQ